MLLLIAVIAIGAHIALMGAYIHAPHLHGDVSSLVCVPEHRIGKAPFEHIRVGFPGDGYDGQAYYAIARNPWAKQNSAEIDKPSYRHLRLLYPAFAWVASGGGHPTALLWALPALNLLAIGGLAGFAARFAAAEGRSPWWGLLLPFAINAGMPALRDLTDPWASFAAFLLAIAWIRQWHTGWLAVSAGLAVFAREQNLVVVAIVLVLGVADRDARRVAALVAVCCIWAVWAALLWRMYDDSPFPMGNFGPPFAGILKRLADPTGKSTGVPIHLFGLGCLLLEMTACLLLPIVRANRFTILIAGAGVGLAVMGSSAIFEDVHAYLRVFAWIPMALWIGSVQSRQRWPFWFTIPLAPWPALAVLQVWRMS
jgi:hypothetical protein